MNTIVLQSLGWALVHLLWQGALVALALAVALRIVDRRAASLRYLLSCGALALLLVLPVLTAWQHAALLSQTSPESPLAVLANPAQPVGPPFLAHPEPRERDTPLIAGNASGMGRLLTVVSEHMPWLVLAWGLGVAVSSLRLLSGWSRLRRLIREAEPAPSPWQTSLDQLAGRLGMTRPVRLLRSAALEVPAAVGWLRPAILLPVATLSGLSARQVEMVLAHELAHLRRHDFVVNLVQTLVETLLFYHPAVWWMSRVIRVEREHCCDDIAVGTSGSAVSYARALAALESLRASPLPLASPALSALGGSLTDRVRRLVGAPQTRCSSRWAGASVITLLTGLAVATPLAVLALPLRSVPSPAAAALPATASVTAQGAPVAPAEPPVTVWAPTLPSAPARLLAQAPVPVPVPVPVPQLSPIPPISMGPKHGPAQEHDGDDKDDDDDNVRVDSAQLSVDQIVELKTAGVTSERVKEIEAMGYAPTVGNLVQFGQAGVTAEYSQEMTGVLGHKPTADELVEMKHVGVSAQQAKALAALVGQDKLSADDLTQAAALNLNESFIRELREAGYDKLPFDELVQLRAVGVTPQYIQALKAAGYDKLSAEQLTEFKSLGVSPEYLRSLHDAGLDKLPAEEVVELRAVGVTPEFIRKMRDEGLDKLTVEQLVQLRSSGVDADFVRELRKKK